MLTSGNGQHRRPRQAPKIVVAVGATGAGFALPLLAAASAHAASASTWDRVASCESGGMWSADQGDGFYGGLALTQNVWEQFGGTALAASPDLASRQEQIAVAEKILDDQGPGYWSGCAVPAGLGQGGVSATTPPDDEPTTDPGLLGGLLGGSPSSGTTGSPSATASASAPPSATADPKSSAPGSAAPSASATAPAPSSSAPASTGRHAKPPAAGTGTGTGSGTGSSGAVAGSPAAGPGSGQQADGSGPYTVQPGDNLYEIATKYSLPGGWPALFEGNRAIVGSDPDLILPGQQLSLG